MMSKNIPKTWILIIYREPVQFDYRKTQNSNIIYSETVNVILLHTIGVCLDECNLWHYYQWWAHRWVGDGTGWWVQIQTHSLDSIIEWVEPKSINECAFIDSLSSFHYQDAYFHNDVLPVCTVIMLRDPFLMESAYRRRRDPQCRYICTSPGTMNN